MARIQTLGLPTGPVERPAAAPVRGAGPDLAEYGASGTPIFGGFLRERGEYNPDLVGLQAVATYEQMRRGDAQVAATLLAIKLPIRSAVWEVTVDHDARPVELEAAEFVRTCLFRDNNFTEILRNALLMLDFGVAAHENVWEAVGNRIRLAKAAPRLPLTYYRWITNETGEELEALEQMGYRGGTYLTTQVPADKLSLFTYNQEGQNYTGLSLLRPMYQHWYMKTNLYKVDAIACERNGMGVPVVTLGPDAKSQDIDSAKAWVSSLIAHERTGLVLPTGWGFKLEGVTGTLRDPKGSIEHHNTAISMAGLAMFMMRGSSHSGSRALGATMADFFFMGLEATSSQIARVLTETVVKPLCDFNFAGLVNYPRVVPQQILTLKFEAIVDALQRLATSGVIEPDDTLESSMRERMGLPEVDKASVRGVPATLAGKGVPVPAVPGTPEKPANDQLVVDGPSEGGDAGVSELTDQPTAEEIAEASLVIKQAMSERRRKRLAAMDVGSVHVGGAMGSELNPDGEQDVDAGTGAVGPVPVLRRAPRGAEVHLALSEIVGALDKGRDEIAAALRAARPAVQSEIIHKVLNRPVGSMHKASVDADAKLVAKVQGILEGVAAFGRDQVGQERKRQLAGAAPGDAATIRMAAVPKDPIGLFAEGVVSEFTNTLSSRATNVVIDLKRKAGLTDGEILQKAEEWLDEQSDKWIDGVGSKGANEAFADGRSDGYEAYADEISNVIYSALLDTGTCEACAAADGDEGATPDEITDVPNPDCDGGDRCRCVHVYVFNDEKARVK